MFSMEGRILRHMSVFECFKLCRHGLDRFTDFDQTPQSICTFFHLGFRVWGTFFHIFNPPSIAADGEWTITGMPRPSAPADQCTSPH